MTPFYFIRNKRQAVVFASGYARQRDFEDAAEDCRRLFGPTGKMKLQPIVPMPAFADEIPWWAKRPQKRRRKKTAVPQ